MAQHLFLYSTCTWLSFVIAEEFYRGDHFVWCTPYFDADAIPQFGASLPPTSCPKEIYLSLAEEVLRGDRHSAKIESTRRGILKGAAIKHSAGVVSDAEFNQIKAMVELAETRDFKPLLYIIPFEAVESMLQDVPIRERAHPLSPEFMIERLPRKSFDVLDFTQA
jgi:hypothetical protein